MYLLSLASGYLLLLLLASITNANWTSASPLCVIDGMQLGQEEEHHDVGHLRQLVRPRRELQWDGFLR